MFLRPRACLLTNLARPGRVSRACLHDGRATTTGDLKSQLRHLIDSHGPITLSHYMRQCLTHPTHGYYMRENPFGAKGDFITSPEISQMFGEMVAIWYILHWKATRSPSEINLIELGPGNGTLMADLMRTSAKFPQYLQAVRSIHLIEASPRLREIQRKLLCGSNAIVHRDSTWQAMSTEGKNIVWHEGLQTVPTTLTNPFILAHEFFDALPIHAFERAQDGWRELLVNYKEKLIQTSQSARDIELVLTVDKKISARAAAVAASPRFKDLPVGSRIEVSTEAHSNMVQITSLLNPPATTSTGCALIIDYGPSDTAPINSLRGIKSHKFVSPFADPGQADLSVDVDFTGLAIQARTSPGMSVHGPVPQHSWLHGLGIGTRAERLSREAPDAESKGRLIGEYQRLVDVSGMGSIYKVLGLTIGTSDTVGF